MRLIKVKVPEGQAEAVAQIALDAGISQVGIYPQEVRSADGKRERKAVVDIETSTPLSKRFLDALLESPVYDARQMSYSLRDARAIVSSKDDVSRLTMPMVEPVPDVFEHLWQFVHVTPGFIARVVVAALLLSYGMVHDRMLVMAAGLLFMPAMPLLLSVAFGTVTASWRLVGRALLAMVALTALTVGTGYVVGMVTSEHTIKFNQFTPLLPSLALSLAIGLAAGIATTDDVGWKELIGLAAASQFSLIPAWLGVALVKGFGEGGTQTLIQRLQSFGLNTVAIVVVAAAVYAVMKMRAGALHGTEHKDGNTQSVAEDLQPRKMAAA